MDFTSRVLLWTVLVIIYAIILFFLLEPGILREIRSTQVRTIEKPIIQTVERPVVREVVRTVDRPVVRTVEVEKPVYIERPRTRLSIPKYDYLGSSETMTYHRRTCRLGKLIKKKYKISNNSPVYFRSRKFKPCKVCIKRSK